MSVTGGRAGLPDITNRLFVPGLRLGWDYLDRGPLVRAFPEPAPGPPTVDAQTQTRFQLAQQRIQRHRAAWRNAGCVMAFAPGAVAAYVIARLRYRSAERAYQAGLTRATELVRGATAEWAARKAEFERTERDRVAAMPAWWGADVRAGTRQIEIFGGNAFGWEGLLTVLGTSIMASRPPLMVIDLSQDEVTGELIALSRTAGRTVDEQNLPADLATCDLLAGLSAPELLDVLLEVLYRDEATVDRANRAVDGNILSMVGQVLGDSVTVGRLAEAMLAVLGEPARPTLLTADEWDRVATDLFSANYVSQAHDRFRQIHAFLSPLAGIGTRPRERVSNPDMVSMLFRPGSSAARTELLTDLTIQWLIRLVDAERPPMGALVLVGADKVAQAHIERLSEICQRRGVLVVVLFRHLRDGTVRLIGDGAVGIMRLGNHQEAGAAADFVGKEYSFKLSQLTRSTGGSQTHTTGQSYSAGVTQGQNSSVTASPDGRFTTSVGGSTGSSRTWGMSASESAGTNWSEGQTTQRVYEYRVEPSVIQQLPDYAMLLVEAGRSGPVFRPVDVNPDLITRMDVTTRSLNHGRER